MLGHYSDHIRTGWPVKEAEVGVPLLCKVTS